MQMITMVRQAPTCDDNWGVSVKHRKEAFRLLSCYVVTHKSPNRGLLIVGCLARLVLGKPSADHPHIRLGAAVTVSGAVIGWLIKEQPD